MKILPVIDLQGGVVVRGIAGRRDEYRPIVSKLCDDPSPAAVARGLREAFGFDECYVADLDAIAGGRTATLAYIAIDDSGMRPWIDAGPDVIHIPENPTLFILPKARVVKTIVGLESLPDDVGYAESIHWSDKHVFSLDLLGGRPLTQIKAWADWSAERIADQMAQWRVATMIVLDLAGVGVGQGVPTLDLCRRLRAKYPKLQLVSGGGVRDVDDLKQLRDAGCDYALVASALHDGRITPEQLQQL
jgi:phosphoribosylformimino-5-aminoimidazole carboxamide ribotide isomerase